jgi:DNA polymerase IV
MSVWQRAILHVDMDAFYASVEQRDDPSLRGKPVIVGGDGRRGVVATCSYEARKFGVKSAMPSVMAKRLCSHAVFVAPRMSHYAQVSKELMEVFGRFSPVVEPLSLDEAFLDITGMEQLFGAPMEQAWKLQKAVREAVSLSCSVGVASNKFVAKVASDIKKPGGLLVVQPGEEASFLAPMPVERLWGVGPKTAERLRSQGFATIADIAAAKPGRLDGYGVMGAHMQALARGEDDRAVDDDRTRKSLGAERTVEEDIRGLVSVRAQLLPLIDEVAAELRAKNLRCGGIRVKIKTATFHRHSRELQLPEPIADALSLRAAIDALLPRLELDEPIRLVGLSATHLVDGQAPRQVSLFGNTDIGSDRDERVDRVVDGVVAKFGKDMLKRGG